MSNYTPSMTLTTEFEGDSVVIKLRRIKRTHVMSMMPYMKRLPGTDDFEPDESKFSEMFDTICSWIEEYIESITGLVDTENNPININTIIEEQYFFPLLQEIAMKLLNSRGVSAKDAKKSDSSSGIIPPLEAE